jgi:hypothetical protein
MRLLPIAVIVLGLACAGDCAAWGLLTHELRVSLEDWRQGMQAQGWTVHTGTPAAAGFPFSAELILPDIRIAGGDAALPAGLDWAAEQVDLSVTLLHPFHLLIEPQGRQSLRISRSPKFAFTADRIAAWVRLGRLRPGSKAHVQLLADGVSGGIAGSNHPRDVEVGHLGLDIDAARTEAGRTEATLRMDAHGVALPDTVRWPLGATVNSVSAEAALSSPSLDRPGPDHGPDSDTQAAATAWRDGQGKVTIRDFQLSWGPLGLGVQAEFGLDSRLQPSGHGIARASGYDEALDALARSGTIPPGVADTAKAVLGLMGRSPANQTPGVEMPFGLKDSTLSLGKIPLTKVRDVDWGRV